MLLLLSLLVVVVVATVATVAATPHHQHADEALRAGENPSSLRSRSATRNGPCGSVCVEGVASRGPRHVAGPPSPPPPPVPARSRRPLPTLTHRPPPPPVASPSSSPLAKPLSSPPSSSSASSSSFPLASSPSSLLSKEEEEIPLPLPRGGSLSDVPVDGTAPAWVAPCRRPVGAGRGLDGPRSNPPPTTDSRAGRVGPSYPVVRRDPPAIGTSGAWVG